MSRKGRPRVAGVKREPNGRAKRPTLEQIAVAEQAARLAEVSFVLGQPHRRFAKNPREEMLVTALGRYADRVGLSKELLEAGIEYAELWRKSFVRQDIEGVYRDPSNGPLGGAPTADDEARYAETTRRVVAARVSLEHAALRRDPIGFAAARHLVIDDQDIPPKMWDDARRGLYVIGIELGICKNDTQERNATRERVDHGLATV
jgi:hypothetical protein